MAGALGMDDNYCYLSFPHGQPLSLLDWCMHGSIFKSSRINSFFCVLLIGMN